MEVPSQRLEYLGISIDSEALSFTLPTEKANSLKQLCHDALKMDKISLRSLAKILGNFSWAIPTVPFAQSHYRNLQVTFVERSKQFKGNLNSLIVLNSRDKEDLNWWIDCLNDSKGKVFITSDPDLIIYADASLAGWGAACGGAKARGPWTINDSKRHINELELLAAFNAIRSFADHSKNIAIRLFLDNSTAMCYINKGGGTKSRSLTTIAQQIISWCESRSITIQALHVPGLLNSIADAESRAKTDSSDWKLDPYSFKNISDLWELDIDLFASC